MKRTLIVVATAATALAATGLAIAKGLDSNVNARAVSGSFAATSASKVQTRTCTTTDGKTLVTTNGVYTGTASGDADLTGAATLRAHSTINTTDNIGVVSGTLRIDVASGRDTQAQFDTVFSGGQIAGLAVGHAHAPAARLVANLAAGRRAELAVRESARRGEAGKLGASAGGAAVELGPGRCRATAPVKQRSEARGTVSAVSSSSITVAGLTCAVPASLQSRVAKLTVDSRAEIHCTLVNGTNTLTDAKGRH